MDQYYAPSVSATPVRQVGKLTTPVKKLRTPLTRTISSPALHYGLAPELYTPVAMVRRDSTSSFASSIDSWPVTPLHANSDFVAPEMIHRTYSSQGRPRSSTAGSASSSFHPYYPSSLATPSSASAPGAKMVRRHTHMGSSGSIEEEISHLSVWAAQAQAHAHAHAHAQAGPLPYYDPTYPMEFHDPTQVHSMSRSAATSVLHSGASTPMQHTLSSPLSELGVSHLNRGDVLPLIVSSMDKAHVCPQCNRRFKRLEHVKRHERSHTLEKPFSCSFEGCGRHFSRSDNLKAHEKTHFKNGRNYRAMEKKRLSQEAMSVPSIPEQGVSPAEFDIDGPTTPEQPDASLFDTFVGVSSFINDDDFSEFTIAI